MMLYLTDIGKA